MASGSGPADVQQSPVTAIDIALEPDQTMLGHARSANAALLNNFPKGYALDATHHAHVSMFLGYVPTADLLPRSMLPPVRCSRRKNTPPGN
jgi:hypothetical protein